MKYYCYIFTLLITFFFNSANASTTMINESHPKYQHYEKILTKAIPAINEAIGKHFSTLPLRPYIMPNASFASKLNNVLMPFYETPEGFFITIEAGLMINGTEDKARLYTILDPETGEIRKMFLAFVGDSFITDQLFSDISFQFKALSQKKDPPENAIYIKIISHDSNNIVKQIWTLFNRVTGDILFKANITIRPDGQGGNYFTTEPIKEK